MRKEAHQRGSQRVADGVGGYRIGARLKALRIRCGLSLRELGRAAGVTAANISLIERDATSPSLATLHKVLAALGSDLAAFLGEPAETPQGPKFPRERMRQISDAARDYTVVFPRRGGIAVEMLNEQIRPASEPPPFERLRCDVAGYVLDGEIVLEVRGRPRERLRAGDAFYILKGVVHRGFAVGDEPARLITVYSPPGYETPETLSGDIDELARTHIGRVGWEGC